MTADLAVSVPGGGALFKVHALENGVFPVAPAYAEDGLLYLKSNGSILVSMDRTEIRRTYYKDYRKLIEEAKKQFPGASLSDEKKTRYNVD